MHNSAVFIRQIMLVPEVSGTVAEKKHKINHDIQTKYLKKVKKEKIIQIINQLR